MLPYQYDIWPVSPPNLSTHTCEILFSALKSGTQGYRFNRVTIQQLVVGSCWKDGNLKWNWAMSRVDWHIAERYREEFTAYPND